MAIFQDSVLVGGFIFFLSTYSLWFSTKKISNSQFESKTKKKLNILAIFIFTLVVIFIFAYHSNHYINNISS